MATRYIIQCIEKSGVIRHVTTVKTYKGIIKSWLYSGEFYPEIAHKYYIKQAAEKISEQLNLFQPDVYTYIVIPYVKPKYLTKKQLNKLCY